MRLKATQVGAAASEKNMNQRPTPLTNLGSQGKSGSNSDVA